jgi:E3 ubiquitin-protein ligase NRDP1
MAFNSLTEFSSYPIISERVTNLNNEYADLVHCPICGNILWKPVTCSLCENSFCFQCIQTWLFKQQEQINEDIYNNNNEIEFFSLTRCPFNCSPYKQRKCSPLLISILSKLTIECQNKSYGCKEILIYEQLEKHEKDFCQYQVIQCSGCKQNMFKAIFDKSQHLLKCLYIDIECTKCQSIFKRKDQHNQFDCLEKQFCLLRQNMLRYEEKSSKIFDILRKKIEIIDEKFIVIEDIWENDDKQIDKEVDSIPTSTQSFSLQSIKKWKIIIGIEFIIAFLFTLLIYIRIFF